MALLANASCLFVTRLKGAYDETGVISHHFLTGTGCMCDNVVKGDAHFSHTHTHNKHEVKLQFRHGRIGVSISNKAKCVLHTAHHLSLI